MADDPVVVIVDEWPLVRLGVAQVMRARGARIAGEVANGAEGVHLAITAKASHLFLGLVHDAPLPELARRALAALADLKVVALVDHSSRDELAGMAGHGVAGLVARTVRPEELAGALDRIDRGERVISPGLLPMLVGVVTTGDDEVGEGGLTRKEREVLARLAQGLSNREIAEALYITPATVKTHLTHIYTKLGAANRQEALARAVALGVLT